jgi:hypothetical protein
MNERAWKFLSAVAACVALLFASPPSAARAANLEPAGINLGGTSFLDGFGRTQEGFTYLGYLQYGRARRIDGCNQVSMPSCDPGRAQPYFNNPAIDAFIFVNQLVYTLPRKLFGDRARLGIDFILPLVAFDTSFDKGPPFPGLQLTDNGIGIGDLTFGPLLQFKPVMAGDRPVFSMRAEFDVIAPIGKYDPGKDINQSSNFFSLNPYVAATVMPLRHLEISARLNYLYNFKNYRPALGRLYGNQVPPPIKSAQAGQAAWVNFAASYEVVHGFNVGVNGYYFHQFNLDLWELLDGSSNQGLQWADFGELRILAVGPGMYLKVGEHDKLFANLYFQTMVQNGPKSTVVNLRWVHGF